MNKVKSAQQVIDKNQSFISKEFECQKAKISRVIKDNKNMYLEHQRLQSTTAELKKP